jgi:MFS family permease
MSSATADVRPAAAGIGGRPRRRDFPGWRMVWVLAVTETISYAALYYCFAVMVVPMRDAFGATTGQLSGALTVAIAVSGAAAIPVGRWVDRHGARWLMTTGSLLGAVAVVGWSRARSLPELYAAFVGIGLASAAVLYEPAFAVINTWFRRDRHKALLTMTVIAGFSSTIFVPTSQVLVDAVGWRAALLVLAALMAACAVPHAVVLRRAPADLAMEPDGSVTAAGVMPGRAHEVLTPVEPTWNRRAVRWLTGAVVLQTVAVTAVAVHLVAYLRDTGASAGSAAGAAGALGILSVAGRVTLTRLATRAGLAPLAAVMVTGQAGGVGALLLLPYPVGVVAFVVLFGAGFGVMTIAKAALLGTYVPPHVFASVSGRQALASNAGRVMAPIAVGILITSWGYSVAFTAVAACSLGAGALLLKAGRSDV